MKLYEVLKDIDYTAERFDVQLVDEDEVVFDGDLSEIFKIFSFLDKEVSFKFDDFFSDRKSLKIRIKSKDSGYNSIVRP